MNRLATMLPACALALLPLGMTAAAAPEEPSRAPPREAPAVDEAAPPAFEQLDADADRTLTLAEVPEHTRLHRDFAHWDANKDGVLNLPEYRRYAEQLAQL